MSYTTLYIGGAGRSGSTLLEILLSNQKSSFCVGEVREYFNYSRDSHTICGCGDYVCDCSFWMKVAKSLENQGIDTHEVGKISQKLTRSRNLWKLPFIRKFNQDWGKLVHATEALYDTVAHLSGATYIIDSSKSAMQLAVLKEFKNKSGLKMIHQVRDARGVAYSWSRNIKLIETEKGLVEFPRRSYYMAGIRWVVENAAIEYISRKLERSRVSYENLAENPKEVIRNALSAISVDPEEFDIPASDGKIISIQPDSSHSIGGNPMRRFADGAAIKCDAKWKEDLSIFKKLGLGLLTYPSLRRYGYKL